MTKEQLPEVELYSIGPQEADHAAPLLTAEAVEYIKSGQAFGMAMVEEGEARAAACARLLPENEAVLELLSLYVAPAFRRRALGGTLLMELLEETMAATDGGLRWVTASFLPGTEGVEPLLTKAGFRMERDEQAVSWKLAVADLADSPLMKRPAPAPAGCTLHTLEELPDYCLRQLVQELARNGINDLTAAEMRQALQTSSYVLLDRQGQPKACAIFSPQGDNGVYLSQFFVAGGSAGSAMAVLQAGGKALLEQLPGGTVLEIPTLTASSARLVQKLIPSSRDAYLTRAILELTGPRTQDSETGESAPAI